MAAIRVTDTADGRPGARIETNDLATLTADPAFGPLLRETLADRLVVLLHAETIEGPAFEALMALLGQPRPPRLGGTVPDHATIQLFRTAAKPDATWQEAEDVSHILHVDYSNLEAPPAFSLQHQRSANDAVRPARWVDMRAAYAGLPASLQQRIAPLQAVHSPFPDQVNLKVHREVADMPADMRTAGTLHPLVCHDAADVPFLFLPVRRDSLIPGLDPAESRALLTELWNAVEASPAAWSAPVRPGDIAIWDNIAATHTRAPFDLTIPREVWFGTIHGVRPVAADAGRLAAE